MRSTRGGFTLIELVVVVGLLGVVTSLGIQAFGAMSARWRDAAGRAEMQARAENALDSIRRDLLEAPAATMSGQGLLGESNEVPGGPLALDPYLADDSVVIPVPDPLDPGRLLLVRYSIERSRELPRLMRSASYDGLESRAAVAEGVLAMTVRFREGPGAAWLAEWNHNRIPGQVAVSLVLVDPRNPAEQLARREVVTLHAR